MSEERLNHLEEYIQNFFVSSLFDKTLRQMCVHKVSSSFVNERIKELFNSLLNQERSIYLHQLNQELNDCMEENDELQRKIEEKRARIEKHMERAFNEHTQARVENINEKMRECGTNLNEGMNSRKNKRKVEFLNRHLSEAIESAQEVKEDIYSLQKLISEIASQNLSFVKQTKIEMDLLKDKNENDFVSFKNSNFDSARIQKLEEKLQIKREKTNRMQESIERTLSFISSLDKENEEITIENYSTAKIRLKIRTSMRKQRNDSILETYRAIGCNEPKISEALDVISEQIEDGVLHVDKKYKKVLIEQQERIANVGKQLDNAKSEIKKLKMEKLRTKEILREMEDVEKQIKKQGHKTDNKYSVLKRNSKLYD